MSGMTTLEDAQPDTGDRQTPVFLDLEHPGPASVGAARRDLRRLLDEADIDPDVTDAAVLILSELVTNALLHARQGARIGVAVTATATRIAMAVTDTPKPGRRCTYQDPDQHGRGMILVRRLAVVTETGGAGWHTVTAVIQTGEVR